MFYTYTFHRTPNMIVSGETIATYGFHTSSMIFINYFLIMLLINIIIQFIVLKLYY